MNTDWNAVSAVSTLAATLVALPLGVQSSLSEKKRRRIQAGILRHQITVQLIEIARFIGDKALGQHARMRAD